MFTWKQLAQLPVEEYARQDLAATNLACAAGLPGSETFDNTLCLQKIDGAAANVHWQTIKSFRQFEKRPEDFHHSRAYFRMLVLVTVLQRDCGLRYNPAKIPEDVPFEAMDSFIPTALLGAGGTCASMPVVYVAVGRRLGYPLKLVSANGQNFTHLFVRWEGEGQRLNIEGTGEGLSCHPDDHYRVGRYALTSEHEAKGSFLRSKTELEELAFFLMERFHCWKRLGNYRQAVEAAAWASSLEPANLIYLNTLKTTLNDWRQKLHARQPQEFPKLLIKAEERRFPKSFPLKLVQDIQGLEALENLLNDKEHDRNWWAPQRRGENPRIPVTALVDFAPDCSCRIGFRFSPPGFSSQGFNIQTRS